jgi:Outer membrane protein beta-barrel domain
MRRIKRTLLATLIGLSAAPLAAQELYFGGGVAYTNGTSDAFLIGPTSDLEAGMLSLIVGQRFAAGNGFWGWETSADLSFGKVTNETGTAETCAVDGANAPYLCEHTATLRLVGVYGTPIGEGTEVFGTLGLGMLMGDYADDTFSVESATTYGLTAGIGVNGELRNGLIARAEVIHDDFGNTTQEANVSDYSGTTVRFALLHKF